MYWASKVLLVGIFFIPRTISIEGKAYMVKMAVAAIPFGREMPRFGRQFVFLISGRLAESNACIALVPIFLHKSKLLSRVLLMD